MLVRTGKIAPEDYPFRKFIDEQKHLDTDETRHKIKSIQHIMGEHFKGEEHKYCDKEQLDANGKFRRPKKLIEAESRGFKTVMEMYEADKKAEEDAKKSEVDDLKKKLADLTAIIEKIPKKYLGQ